MKETSRERKGKRKMGKGEEEKDSVTRGTGGVKKYVYVCFKDECGSSRAWQFIPSLATSLSLTY